MNPAKLCSVIFGMKKERIFQELQSEQKEKLIKKSGEERVIDNAELPVVYNVNFGHATPRCALQYGVVAKVDMKQKKIILDK